MIDAPLNLHLYLYLVEQMFWKNQAGTSCAPVVDDEFAVREISSRNDSLPLVLPWLDPWDDVR